MGEAVSGTHEERLEDMLAIGSVVYNRAALHGVTPEQIVSARRQFDAYGRALPAGVEKYRALAKEAWENVQANGPIHSGTYFATPGRVKGLPNGLEPVTSTTGHRYFLDPEFRPIQTAVGVKRADPTVAQQLMNGLEEVDPVMAYSTVPERRPEMAAFDAITNAPLDDASQTAIENAIAQNGLNELGAVEREGYGSPLGAMGDRITSGFGLRDRPRTSQGYGSRFHQGTDLSLGPGAANYPTEAVAGGVVEKIYSSPTLGNTVEVRHNDGFLSRYSHLNEIGNLSIGEEVARGTPVGMVGSTGNSGAAHLHFSMEDADGNLVDPASVVDFNRENSLPTPQFAERAQPGDMISSLVNDAVRPSLGDPNDALAASFNMDRFAGPTQEQIANFDADRFGIRATPDTKQIQGEQGLEAALTASNNQAGLSSQAMADLQQRANEARRNLEEQARQSAMETQQVAQSGSIGIDGQATASTGVSAASGVSGLTPRPTTDVLTTAGIDNANMTPEAALAADVYDQRINTKQARTPTFAGTQQKLAQDTGAITADPEVATFSAPQSVDGVAVSQDVYAQPSKAKKDVERREKAQQAEAADPNKGRMARAFGNSKTMGTALGATIGSLIGGPVGALALGAIGGKLGNMPAAERPRESPLEALFNMMTGKPQSEFPTTPRGGRGTGKGVSFNDLSKDGRDIYHDSGDFRDAIDRGGVGLY
ncbi:MAG: M23 family metallopeptidase [Proteobacteria bacterium]|nr:M23 family metallopeptidase [Pseudomonadota bacterium]